MKNKNLEKNELDSKKNISSIERRAFLKKAILASTITAPIIQSLTIDKTFAGRPSWAGGPGGNPNPGTHGPF